MSRSDKTDILIIGSGILGLSIAWQLLEKHSNISITIIDKETSVGKHSSGRNSGVLHSGIYYQPGTLKARVCVNGAKRLYEWCVEENLEVLKCGKVVTPQKPELDAQLDLLKSRGEANGAKVEIIDQQQFYELAPDGYTSTGRALWSPGTSVVKPLSVVQRLKDRLQQKGVRFLMTQSHWKVTPEISQVVLDNKSIVSYGHLFNSAGLQADLIAHRFGLGMEYAILPFKGSYYQLKDNAPFKLNTNLYPVPDLDVPFLGVHVTPSIDGSIYLGPTATPALGRENYHGMQGFELFATLGFFRHLGAQMLVDKKMRKYVYNQAFDWMPYKFLEAAKTIVPKLKMSHIKRSQKVGIRPQLYNKKKRRLEQDFIMINASNSTHIINAISPAFTASFELADHIINNTDLNI